MVISGIKWRYLFKKATDSLINTEIDWKAAVDGNDRQSTNDYCQSGPFYSSR